MIHYAGIHFFFLDFSTSHSHLLFICFPHHPPRNLHSCRLSSTRIAIHHLQATSSYFSSCLFTLSRCVHSLSSPTPPPHSLRCRAVVPPPGEREGSAYIINTVMLTAQLAVEHFATYSCSAVFGTDTILNSTSKLNSCISKVVKNNKSKQELSGDKYTNYILYYNDNIKKLL